MTQMSVFTGQKILFPPMTNRGTLGQSCLLLLTNNQADLLALNIIENFLLY